MSFTSDVQDFVVNFEDASEETIRGTCIELFSAIIKSSPVDEGIFRSNWYVSSGTPSSQVNDKKEVSESTAIQVTVNGVLAVQDWANITFTNNLPYSEVIEFGGYPTGSVRDKESKVTFEGFSKQAPKGVVRSNIKRFNALIEKEARKNGIQ